jgi:2,4-dichlorophenol 6-monooxygenase
MVPEPKNRRIVRGSGTARLIDVGLRTIRFMAFPFSQASVEALVGCGPTWGKKCEEWVIHFPCATDDPTRFDHEAVVPKIRSILNVPDLDLTVHRISHWNLERVTADRYREVRECFSSESDDMHSVIHSNTLKGRIFLAGDAAHRYVVSPCAISCANIDRFGYRHPPTTGLGLNTAVQVRS